MRKIMLMSVLMSTCVLGAYAANVRQVSPSDPIVRSEAVPERFQGTVTLVEDKAFTISIRERSEKQFKVNDETTINVNDRAATIDDLQPGHMAVVIAEQEEGQLIAKFVDAKSQW